MPQRVHDLGTYLAGGWEVARTLVTTDHVPIGTFEGRASFTADGTGVLDYREQGTLRLADGRRLLASRSLRYHLDGSVAEVRFADGRAFHRLDLRTGADDADHPCRDDHYRGRTEVVDDDRWRQTWDVTGPAKAYRSTTLFRRLASGASTSIR